ncbi:MAG: bifunctional 4-hydroxy-2-oxoglutarate aldolase/2-dehydro-3-deoxy-phosphogluconate aldolase [Treponema sp.]|jgi:2-dehydro-3-deoxyphosphogluconate aldolase/(4S)-4-hydroxy-2-oxoglutarate aldolase|nr:bifunctional 4-hydroxy-2-oxoglutarate aldolase/2-dehydro-3-deoxy-phosphogluconate aldolase [Treponema sp.]
MRDKVIGRILEDKIIAIVRGTDEELILPLGEALLAGGITLMEITFNQAKPESFTATLGGITRLRERFGDRLFVGAGTVLSEAQVDLAGEAGALYIVSPNTNPLVIRRTRDAGLVSLPGALSPSECISAHEAGADFVKLFPAADLGTAYLKAIRAPLSHIKFLAVGGINETNAAAFIGAGALGLGIGGNLVNKDWMACGQWGRITDLARHLVEAVKEKA